MEVAADDKSKIVNFPLQDFIKNCNDGFEANKYDPVESGVIIANSIMDEFISIRVAASEAHGRPAGLVRHDARDGHNQRGVVNHDHPS